VRRLLRSALFLAAATLAARTPAAPQSWTPVQSIDGCNLTWNSPSGDSFGSMPLGNGDIGLNVWVEWNGDLVFYISKVDAFDAGHLLPKLGRVRVKFQPALDVRNFRQTLVLRDAAVEVKSGDTTIRVWADANAPVVRVQGRSTLPRKVSIAVESLRPMQDAKSALPASGTAGVIFNDDRDRLAWCYRNQSSAWAANFASQNTPEMVARTKDPLLYRTSGCVLRAANCVRSGEASLASRGASNEFDCSIRVLSSQPASVAAWLAEAERPEKSDWVAHGKYWRSFWDRSHIFVTSCGNAQVNLDQYRFTQFAAASETYKGHKLVSPAQNAFQLSQRYALERFCEAIASRGTVPPPYNGSIFTMDMPAGVMGFDRPKSDPVPPDGRDWAVLSFMWQNTRHPYWAMATRGDYDTLVPGMRFVRDGLDICRDHSQKLLGVDGAFLMEASWWGGVGVFNWDQVPPHLRYHQLATVELPAIMAETYAHTRDGKLLHDVLLPCAEEGLKFYFNRFPKTDGNGRMLMEDVGCAETYQGVRNPATEIGGMKFLLDQLLSFPIDEAHRARFAKWRAMLPDVPIRRVRGMDLLAVGEAYQPGRVDCETPELYSIYPFRQAWLGTPKKLAMARQSFHVRNTSLDGTVDWQPVETGGWQSAPVQAAYLGLAREAARLASINFNDSFIHWSGNIAKGANGELMRGASDSPGFVVGDPKSGLPFPYRPRPRFPAFWECKMDGTPDNDHGANSVNTLQSMLLQSDGRKIYLLPAWPENWDVSFKLCANDNTTVECVYRGGEVRSLQVSPRARRADIVDFSAPEARIRTLVDVACSDRNWLFDLPPMLDGLPQPGPVTSPWIKKYGESVTNVKGAPWPNCVFRGNVLYVHNGAAAPKLRARVVSTKRLSDTILKVEYDRPIEPLARASASAGSLTLGKSGTEVDFGRRMTFDRLEFTIENPGYQRGQAKAFELQAQQTDGSWRTVHQGQVFGTIYAKEFAQVTVQRVRLKVSAKVIQFDLFHRRK